MVFPLTHRCTFSHFVSLYFCLCRGKARVAFLITTKIKKWTKHDLKVLIFFWKNFSSSSSSLSTSCSSHFLPKAPNFASLSLLSCFFEGFSTYLNVLWLLYLIAIHSLTVTEWKLRILTVNRTKLWTHWAGLTVSKFNIRVEVPLFTFLCIWKDLVAMIFLLIDYWINNKETWLGMAWLACLLSEKHHFFARRNGFSVCLGVHIFCGRHKRVGRER